MNVGMVKGTESIRSRFRICFRFGAKSAGVVVSLLLSFCNESLAESEHAIVFNAENTTVQFGIDSTWHKIEGVAKQVQGNASISSTGAVSGSIEFAVAKFDTDNGLRDEKLRSIMAQDTFPIVTFRPKTYSGSCVIPENGKVCRGKLQGTVQIRNVEKDVEVLIETTGEESDSIIVGHSSIHWRDFGVEDPSMFVARLAEEVSIDVKIRMKTNDVAKQGL